MRKTGRGISKIMIDNLTINKNLTYRTIKTEVEVEDILKEDLIIKVTTIKSGGHFLIQTIYRNRRGDTFILNSIKRDSSQEVNCRKKKKQYHNREMIRINFKMLKEI